MKKLIILAALLAASTAQAQVYKCVVNGKKTFSDVPCAANAEKMQVRPAAGAADPERAAALMADTRKSAQRMDMDSEIARMERQIKDLSNERDAKMASLQARKLRTYNNLAGATLEQSISTEMQAVATDYNARIDRAEKALAEAKARRAAFDKP